MTPYIEDLVNGVASGDAEAMLGAREIARAHVLHGQDSGVIEPYASFFAANPATADDLAGLKHALLAQLDHQQPSIVAAAIFALGQFQDISLAPTLREQLRLRLQRVLDQYGIVANLIVALRDSGEDLISTGYRLTSIEKNVNEARVYLEKFGHTVPW